MEQKNVNLVIKSFVGEVSDNCGMGMGKEKEDWRLFIVGFLILSMYNFLIRLKSNFAWNQNGGCDKQQNIWESNTENIYRTRILACSCRLWPCKIQLLCSYGIYLFVWCHVLWWHYVEFVYENDILMRNWAEFIYTRVAKKSS